MDTKYAKPTRGLQRKQILKSQNKNPLEKMLGGWMSKIKIEMIMLHTPHSEIYSVAGDINKYHTYKPHSNMLGGSKLQHIVTKYAYKVSVYI